MSVTVSTEQAAKVRQAPESSAWNGIYAMVYLFGVIAFIAVAIYENAWQYRSNGEAFLIAFAWTAPFAAAAHLIHFLANRHRRSRTRRALEATVEQVNAAAAEAGLPRVNQDALRRMLTAKNNVRQPYTGEGKFSFEPLLTWELPTEDPAVLLTATRHGQPETLTLEPAGRSTPEQPTNRSSNTVTILGAYRDGGEAPITASRLRGRPAAPANFTWPTCAEHGTPMQFLAQIEHHDSLLLTFMCMTAPGECDAWDPESGCNAVIPVTGRNLQLAAPPTPDAISSEEPQLLGIRTYEADGLTEAAAAATADGFEPVGQYGGTPEWIQNDETPEDASTFVAALDEYPTGFNFGGGTAYIFTDGAGVAKMLSQT